MINQDLISRYEEKKLNFTSKLYVWSVVFESLLFFILVGQDVSVVGGNLSRILQFFVLISLILKTLMTPYHQINIFNPSSIYFRWYFVYCSFIIISLIYGIFSGAFVGKSDNFNSTILRPGFEYFITIYYFIYFAVLPIFLLNSKKGIDYFFKIFFFMFFLSLFLGAIDYLLVLIIGFEFIPRHLSDMRHVGIRFHGIAGEPRDAFVHLFFGLCLLFLKEIWDGKRFNRVWIPIIILAALLTQSTSGFIGLFIGFTLIILFQITRMSFRNIISFISISLIISGLIGYSVINSNRIQMYIDAAPVAFYALESGLELPPVIMAQIVNIYPVWIRWVEFTEFHLTPLFLGTGLGTASILNGYIVLEGGVLNPHANIIRVVFESGVIGTLLFIVAFINPLFKFKRSTNIALVVILMLIMLGVTFGHRSSTIFTFLGLVILVHLVLSKRELKKSATTN